MESEESIMLENLIRADWKIELKKSATEEDLLNALAFEINRMIQTDFSRLIQLLYRIDISEKKLKELLHKNKQSDAGKIIAHMIIERQKEKIRYRNEHPPGKEDSSGEERW
ncbi:hypothetical protein [Pollutibacter soli]|uniref:hypothetical protein n=1 Tax=Pollutibacter soli TaxID=3034157 RepID=UPI0030136361